jgi:hypothetical protein|tara:strand:+ start:858 stop:1052 length:195 start_codon:yes stop_codon:yes gene_type:complete
MQTLLIQNSTAVAPIKRPLLELALTTISSVKEGEQGNAAQAPVSVVGSTVDEQVASAEHLDIFA